MRIERIHATDFLCHRHVDIDLRELGLFAITGPTGAGKTALTDVVACALFGVVPRIRSKRGVSEFIRHGADKAKVVVEFTLPGGDCYRASRTLSERTGTRCRLEQIDPATRKRKRDLASTVKEMEIAVEDLIGLDYRTFATSVLLPQGQFSRFLSCEPGERQEIVKRLLNLGVLDRLRDRATERESAAAMRAAALGHELDGRAYAEATPDRLKELRAALAEESAKWNDVTARLDVAKQRLTDDEQTVVLQQQLADATTQLDGLAARAGEIQTLADRATAAERANAVRPLLAVAEEAKAALAAAESAATQAQTAREAAARELVEQAAAVDDQRAELADEMEALAAQIDRLHAVMPAADRLERLHRDIGETTAQRDAAERDLARQADAVVELIARLETARREVRRLDGQRALLEGGEPADPAALDALRHRLERLAADTDAWAVASERAADRRKEQRLATATLGRATERVAVAETAVASATGTHQAAMSTLDTQRREHMAAGLRAHLHDGDDCPVCGGRVESGKHPPPEPAELAEAEQAEADARKALSAAEAGLAAARGEHAGAEARARQAVELADERVRDADAWRSRVGQSTHAAIAAANAAGLELDLTGDTPASLGVALKAARKAVDAAYERAVTRRDQLAELDRERATHSAVLAGEAGLEAEQRLHTERADRLGTLTERLQQLEAEAATLRDDVQAVAGDADPQALLHGARARTTRLRQQREQLDRQRADAGRRADRAELAAEAADRALADAAGTHARRAAELDAALVEHHLPSADAVRRDAVDAATLAGWREATRRWQTDHGAARVAADRLREQLGDRHCDSATLAARRADVASLIDTRDALYATVRQLETDADRVERLIVEAGDKRRELEQARRDSATWRAVALDLKADRLPAWIVEQTLTDLAARASAQLQQLTERYDLVVDEARGREFLVVDRFNAGERRSARTLSGGETFLVSLSLALALADSVRAEGGAIGVDLGCLFLDEGFGTLDADSIELAVGALEALQAGGRQIGVISHVDALAWRLPGRVHVRRPVDASTPTVTVEA